MDTTPWASFARFCAKLLFYSALIAQIVVAWRFWAITWDDSAITLGFARTFARTGQIAPTPGSEIVEGYSTTLWMLLMAAAAKVIASPNGLLVTAKVSTLLLNLGSLSLMRRWFRGWLGEVTASSIAGAMGCSFMFYETINGMETPLLLFLIFAMLLVRERASPRWRWVYLGLGTALLLVRFEALWLLVPFVLLERDNQDKLRSGITWLSAFLLEEMVRWRYFGALVPNTIVAKRRFPYTVGTPHEQVRQHFYPLDSIARASVLFVIAMAIYLASRYIYLASRYIYLARENRPFLNWPARIWQNCRQLRFTAVFLCFSTLLTMGIGLNWGPPLRSFYVGWPFLLALLFWPLGWKNIRKSGMALSAAVLAVCLVCVVKVKHQVGDMRSPDAPTYMAHITVDHVRQVGDRLQTIQEATGEKDILFAGPDMGGVQLYSEGVRVLDLGLLCDRTLAREGYGAVGKYLFGVRKPDVILVHDMWTDLVKPGAYASFLDSYRPVVVSGMEMFLRRDLLAHMDRTRLHTVAFHDGSVAEKDGLTATQAEGDRALNGQFAEYFVLR